MEKIPTNNDFLSFPGSKPDNPYEWKFGQPQNDYLNELTQLPIGDEIIYGKMNGIIVEVKKGSTVDEIKQQYLEKYQARNNQK